MTVVASSLTGALRRCIKQHDRCSHHNISECYSGRDSQACESGIFRSAAAKLQAGSTYASFFGQHRHISRS